MKKIVSFIKNASIFHGMDEQEIEAVLNCLKAKTSSYEKGEYVLRTGDSIDTLGLILKGTVLVIQEDFWGNRNLLAKVSQGQLFAESFACQTGAILNVSVVSDEETVIMWLNVKCILSICSNACDYHNRLIRNLLSELSRKNLQLNKKLTHMGKRTTRDKLLSYLSGEAIINGKSEFDITFSRQQLADYLSVERSAMSAELGRLRDSGLIEFERNHFILKHMEEE